MNKSREQKAFSPSRDHLFSGRVYDFCHNQVAHQRLSTLFVAVILVIIATYLLFISGSIKALQFLRKRSTYYYQTTHFINVSTMLYRMKQNAAGLASICILSTMVLVTVATTASLYFGQKNVVETRFPYDFQIESEANLQQLNQAIDSLENKVTLKTGNKSLLLKTYFLRLRKHTYSFNNFEDNSENLEKAVFLTFVTSTEYQRITGKEGPEKDELLVFPETWTHQALPKELTIDHSQFTLRSLTELPPFTQVENPVQQLVVVVDDTWLSEKLTSWYQEKEFLSINNQ